MGRWGSRNQPATVFSYFLSEPVCGMSGGHVMHQPRHPSDLFMVALMSPNTSMLEDTRSMRVVCGSGFKISVSAGSMRCHQYFPKLGSSKFGEQPWIIFMVEWGPFVLSGFHVIYKLSWLHDRHSNARHSHLIKIIFVLHPDDTPVASAKAAPADGLGDADDEGNANGRLWRTVLIGEQEHRIDMQIIRPYLRVITHGGQSVTATIRRMLKEVWPHCFCGYLAFVSSSLQPCPFRLLWRRPQRDYSFLRLLPAWQRLFRLPLHYGKPLPVSVPWLTSFSGTCST